MNKIDLGGRTAIVTGGAQGIGRAIVERFLASGARVAVWDCNQPLAEQVALELGQPEALHVVPVDVTDYSATEQAAKATRDHFGRLDILVANAGIAGMNATVADYPIEEWQRIIDIDLNGVFHCFKAVVPHMVTQNYGRIIATASIAGKEGNPNASAYSAAKAGVIALTKSLGKELAGHDIAVNCITPAAAQTAIFDQMSESHINFMLSKVPRERFVKVEEIAAMVAWLASAENSFTTGAVFDLSGGRATY